jgi:hypothetical protein
MMNEGWKVDRDKDGQLVAHHQHESGERVRLPILTNQEWLGYAHCECGAKSRLDGLRDDPAP